MKRFLWAAILASGPAWATKPEPEPVSQQQNANAAQSQSQHQAQSADALANATNAGVTAANVVSHTSRAFGVGTTSPDAPVCPPGLVPGKARHRGWTGLSFGVSARCTAPDDAEARAMQAARDHEIAMARLRIEELRVLAEQAKEAQRRISAESGLVSASGK